MSPFSSSTDAATPQKSEESKPKEKTQQDQSHATIPLESKKL